MLIKSVVGATRYSFTDKETNRLVEGVNVWFLQDSQNAEQCGKIPAKVSLPIDSWNSISAMPFPCDCEASVEQIFTSRGIKTKITGLKFVK